MSRDGSTEAYMTRFAAKSREVRPPVEVPDCDRLWSTEEVAAFLGVPVTTLHRWRYVGTGPDAFKVGRHLRFDPEVVRRWLVDECRRSA